MQPINQERKNSLSPMQLISELQRDAHQEFSPKLLNEIGVIFLTSENSDDKELAEEVLIRALDVENPKARFVAYCQLRRANGTASENVQEAILLFQAKDSNKNIVEKARKELWL